MAKDKQAFRTISEVSKSLDVPQHVLRFWEQKFHQIKPMKRQGGRRYYRPEDLVLIAGIKTLLYDEGYTIKGVQKVLKEQGVAHVVGWGERRAAAQAAAAVKDSKSSPKEDAPRVAPQLGKRERRVLRGALDDLKRAKSTLGRAK